MDATLKLKAEQLASEIATQAKTLDDVTGCRCVAGLRGCVGRRYISIKYGNQHWHDRRSHFLPSELDPLTQKATAICVQCHVRSVTQGLTSYFPGKRRNVSFPWFNVRKAHPPTKYLTAQRQARA